MPLSRLVFPEMSIPMYLHTFYCKRVSCNYSRGLALLFEVISIVPLQGAKCATQLVPSAEGQTLYFNLSNVSPINSVSKEILS